MKSYVKNLLLFLMIGVFFSLNSCSDDANPLTSPSIVGDWELLTFADSESNFMVNAGEPTEIEPGINLTVDGNLSATETRFSVTLIMSMEMLGYTTETDTMTSTGTYTINGPNLTIVEDGSEESERLKISVSNNRLTMRVDELILVFEKV